MNLNSFGFENQFSEIKSTTLIALRFSSSIRKSAVPTSNFSDKSLAFSTSSEKKPIVRAGRNEEPKVLFLENGN